MYIYDGPTEWEDMILLTSELEAIECSKERPNGRVEIFIKSGKGYIPSYVYIRNGIFNNESKLK